MNGVQSRKQTKRRLSHAGFGLIEVMIACTISIWVLAAVLGMVSGVWMIMRSSLDETQAMLHLSSVRRSLCERVAVIGDAGDPFHSIRLATVLDVSESGIYAKFHDGSVYDSDRNQFIENGLDKRTNKYQDADKLLQYIYLVAEPRKGVKSYARMVVPGLNGSVKWDDIEECFSK